MIVVLFSSSQLGRWRDPRASTRDLSWERSTSVFSNNCKTFSKMFLLQQGQVDGGGDRHAARLRAAVRSRPQQA